jgi:hypothetical protein
VRKINAGVELRPSKHSRERSDAPPPGSTTSLIIPRIYVSNQKTRYIALRCYAVSAGLRVLSVFHLFYFQLVN